MSSIFEQDWDPFSAEVQGDQLSAYDAMRRRCPVAYSEALGWTLFRHADVLRVLLDHATFSSVVSRYPAVPNGMDGREHADFRTVIDPYFSPERVAEFEPSCRRICRDLMAGLRGEVEFTSTVTLPFALGIQCAFLGWPDRVQPVLSRWIFRHQQAVFHRRHEELVELAREFTALVEELLASRREGATSDLTALLMREQVAGRGIRAAEVISILKNWTAGEIGSISAAAGILAHFLARDPQLRDHLAANPGLLDYACDEILRIHGPLVMNRRVATRPVEIGGVSIPAGGRISLNWVSANRDEEVFTDPESFRFDRDVTKNLLYGAGLHACPGAPLARMELRVFVEEMLRCHRNWELVEGRSPVQACYPASGYETLPLKF